MDLKRIFVLNLKSYRKKEGISQMVLAERCNTSASYIGEIEIGYKFPSMKMIGKIAAALNVAPYRFFMDQESAPKDEIQDYLNCLPGYIKKDLSGRLLETIRTGIDLVLAAQPAP